MRYTKTITKAECSLKSNKAITLIALVITIIILLILSGITIATLTGENGLFERAKEAKTKTEIESIKEEIRTEILAEQAGNEGDITEEKLKEILENHGKLSGEEKLEDNILTTDKGKYEIKVSDIFNGTTSKPEEPIFTATANKPDISGFNASNTYYVTWDLSSSPYIINESINISQTAPSNWYDYTAGVNKWANIKTTGGGNDCYWVWIPRYAYKVPEKSNTEQTIEIKFLNKETNIPIGETQEITNTTPTPGTWVVHPAFTNAGNGGFGELTGIWVAKYEASSNNAKVVENPTAEQLAFDGGSDTDIDLKVRVKPNVTSWRGISVNNIFTVCKNLTTSGNSLEGTTKIDSHMMKNTEWGAVAYLSQSKYGKNGQVWNNPWAYDDKTYYSPITGRANKNNNPNEFLNGNETANYEQVTDKYNTGNGPNASTTGNVYGVYDMAGGTLEYVAGYLNEALENDSSLRLNLQSLYEADKKYKDIYAGNSNTDTINYERNKNKYGDSTYETSTNGTGNASWNKDFSGYPTIVSPTFIYGGRAGSGEQAGIFSFYRSTGKEHNSDSFRPTIVNIK